MTKQVLNRGTIANDGTGDTLRTASQKINENFDELYEYLGGNTNGTLSTQIGIENDAIVFEGTSTDDFEVRLKAANATADRILTLPNASGDFVLTTATQTLTNKTITSPTISGLTITDGGSNHEYSLVPADIAANRNINLPLLTDSDEFTFNTHAQTLYNKTLIEPVITGSTRISENIKGTDGNVIVALNNQGGANQVEIMNATSSSNPRLSSIGTDTNIGLQLHAKGTGAVSIESKLVLNTSAITSSGDTMTLGAPISYLNFGTGASNTAVLPDGLQDGEVKYLVNINTASVTVSYNGSGSIVLPSGASVHLVYTKVGAIQDWFVISNNGATIS